MDNLSVYFVEINCCHIVLFCYSVLDEIPHKSLKNFSTVSVRTFVNDSLKNGFTLPFERYFDEPDFFDKTFMFSLFII